MSVLYTWACVDETTQEHDHSLWCTASQSGLGLAFLGMMSLYDLNRDVGVTFAFTSLQVTSLQVTVPCN